MGKLFFSAITLMTQALVFAQGAVAEDMKPKQVQYEFKDYSSSPDVPNCTFAAYISNFPAPELVSVLFRVDASRPKNVMFFSITTDVGEQLYQNGKPSSIRKVPIDQAESCPMDLTRSAVYIQRLTMAAFSNRPMMQRSSRSFSSISRAVILQYDSEDKAVTLSEATRLAHL